MAQARIDEAEVSFPVNPKERAAVSNGPPTTNTTQKAQAFYGPHFVPVAVKSKKPKRGQENAAPFQARRPTR